MKYIFEIEKDRNTAEEYAVIKGLDEQGREIVIPAEVEMDTSGEGSKRYPVRVIGNHSFSSRKDIITAVVPDSVHTILGFAFHNCSNLRKITLTDSVTEYLDGTTRQCENLEEIEVTVKRSNYGIIRRILEDNDRRIIFYIHENDGDAVMVFPGFNYDFVENTMARTIQFAIEGTGYAYRECVKPGEINYREYDNLFSKASADDSVTAEKIAIARLLYPYNLSEEAKDIYENWLRDNACLNLTGRVKKDFSAASRITIFDDYDRPEDVADFYIKRKLIPGGDIAEVVKAATDAGNTALVSMLMEYRNNITDSGVTENNNMLELDF